MAVINPSIERLQSLNSIKQKLLKHEFIEKSLRILAGSSQQNKSIKGLQLPDLIKQKLYYVIMIFYKSKDSTPSRKYQQLQSS